MKFALSFLAAGLLIPLRPVPALAQSEGLPPVWDIREMLASLNESTERVKPLLEKIDPREWIAKGAPEAYVTQLESLRNEIGYVERAANELSQRPDRISKTLEVFLRLQAVEGMMASITEAVRRYQNPAVADLLQGVMDETSAQRQRLREYLVELVALKETEWKIADEEAQRCRAELANRPRASANSEKRQQE